MAENKPWIIKNNMQPNITWNAETEQILLHLPLPLTALPLPLTTKTGISLTIYGGRVGDSYHGTRSTSIRLKNQEDICGAITLTYIAENCLDLP